MASGANLVVLLVGCGTTVVLVGEPPDGDAVGSDEGPPDATDDGAGDADAGADADRDGEVLEGDGFAEGLDDGGDDETAADDSVRDEADGAAEDSDGGPGCPIWAVPGPVEGTADGSEAHPFGGLADALAGRGECDTILLRDGTAAEPFDAGVDVVLAAGEVLAIAGDPAAAARAELDAHGDIGLYVSGEGSLTLRHLAVRNGYADTGGCLNALVASLRLEDTEWTDCRAVTAAAGAWIHAADVAIERSAFLRNATDLCADGEELCGDVGGVWLEGPRDVTRIRVSACRFEENVARWGGALRIGVETRDVVVRDSVFLRNRAYWGGTAVGGTIGRLEHCRFEANGTSYEGPAVQVQPGTPDTLVIHNIFLDNLVARGASALYASFGQYRNNLFVRNVCDHRWSRDSGWCTAALWVGHGGPDVRNNTFVDNSSFGAGTPVGVAHLSFDDAFGAAHSNLFVGGDGGPAIGTDYPEWGVSAPMSWNATWNVPEPTWGEGVTVGDGNVVADPLFSGADDDYTLGAGSAVIDGGDPDPSLADPDGSRNDAGAFGGPDGEWIPLPEGGAP